MTQQWRFRFVISLTWFPYQKYTYMAVSRCRYMLNGLDLCVDWRYLTKLCITRCTSFQKWNMQTIWSSKSSRVIKLSYSGKVEGDILERKLLELLRLVGIVRDVHIEFELPKARIANTIPIWLRWKRELPSFVLQLRVKSFLM